MLVDTLMSYSSTLPTRDDTKPLNWVALFGHHLGQSLRHHRALLIVAVLTWVAAKVLNLYFGRTTGGGTGFYLTVIFRDILPVLGGGALIASVLKVVMFEKSDSPGQALLAKYRAWFLDMSRVTNILVVIAAMILGIGGFSELKPLIHFVNPYSWDAAFMELDRALHFGQDPWRLLDPIFGSEAGTRGINFIYNFWFYIIFVFWLMAAWAKPQTADGTLSTRSKPEWGRQFTLAFMLCWVIGGLFLATLWSSMGPAFYDFVDPTNNPFDAQMVKLLALHESNSLWAIDTQNLLRASYLTPGIGGPEGISAMPSIHNATAALFVFAGFRINKFTGWLMTAFSVCILIGSVHLAWHYAIDGYAGILIAWACWWGAGHILKPKSATTLTA